MDGLPPTGAERTRLYHIDLLRIIAIFFVVFNHTGENGIFRYFYEQGFRSFFHLCFTMLISCAVPIFFTISGALLLDREESLAQLYRKRVLRMFIVLILITFAYQGYACYIRQQPFAPIYYFQQLLDHTVADPLWFLYAYIGMLVTLPLLRKLAKGMSNADFVYLIAAQVVISALLPIALFLWTGGTATLNSQFSTNLITQTNISFVLVGYFLEKRLKTEDYTGKRAAICLAVGIAALAVEALVTMYEMRLRQATSPILTFNTALMAVPTYALYYCVKYFFLKVKVGPFAHKLLKFFGGAAFGVYLLEGFLREITFPVFNYFNRFIPDFSACTVWVLSACLLGTLITAILKKIPLIKKLL